MGGWGGAGNRKHKLLLFHLIVGLIGLCVLFFQPLSLSLAVISTVSRPAAALPYLQMSAVFAFDSMFKEN